MVLVDIFEGDVVLDVPSVGDGVQPQPYCPMALRQRARR